MFSLKLARSKYLTQSQGKRFLKDLCEIPDKIESVLRQQDPIKQAALKIKDAKNVMFIGRGMSEYVAKEGALKLKEISYIPCDAYSGAELKHGPIAMLSDGIPVIAVIPDDDSYERTLSNIHEAKARGSFIITVGSSSEEVKSISDINIPVPKTSKFLSPFLTIIPMQLIAYYTTLELGYNVDKPRNLAKSVTVG
jgi:glucosamine--fructose-6-phosphate aminotransferase (isomerizing)